MKTLNPQYLTKVKASIVENSKNFIGIADAQGKLVYLNNAAYAMMGYGPNEHPEFSTIADIHPSDFAKYALTIVQDAVFEHGFWSGNSYLRHKNGSAIKVSQTVFPVRDENNQPYGTAVIIQDIGETSTINQRMKSSNETLQQVLNSIKIGIVLINMENKTIEMVNRCMEELLQMDVRDIVGRKCYELLCHRDPAICPHVNERDKNFIVAERFLERADGSMLPIIKTGTWITIKGKEYLVDTMVDISIQKDLENHLIEAKLIAETASRSKSEFLSRMSHEMRTPLNAIIGMVQVAGMTSRVEKLKEAIQTIGVSSNHLLELINDVLDLSKIEEGRLELSIEPFAPREMLRKIQSLIAPKAEEKAITFSIDFDYKTPPTLMGDSMRLSQVLLNFLSNAVKFTPSHGRVGLQIKCDIMNDNTALMHYAVSDNGIGMSDEQLKRLFNPFVQADGSIARQFGGTGLGLVISKRILDIMGSTINVETSPGQGSRFVFSLRLPLAETMPAHKKLFNLADVKNIFAGKKALIVDDVFLNRVVAKKLLAITGINLDEASDGAEAVSKALATDYDVIIMDIQMPGMDGYEATKIIRGYIGAKGQVPIVAMSANVFKDDVQHSLNMGMNAHIGKPVDMQSMISTIAQLILPQPAPQAQGLEQQNGDELARLNTAMAQHDYVSAMQLAQQIQNWATQLHLPIIASYASNVYECLKRNDLAYANMYLADLTRAYTARML